VILYQSKPFSFIIISLCTGSFIISNY